MREHSGQEFPQHPREQLDMAINAVFDSWNTDRARLYRRRERIPQDLGTAVNVCTMVFGNLGESSGTGVAFTRDPASGRTGAYGDYLSNAQGEDVVAGIRNTLSLDDLKALDPASHKQLIKVMRQLETHYRDLCDIEFTIERGKLWMLQTRVGKRTAAAAFRIAAQLVDENLITMDEALSRVSGSQLALLMFPQFDRSVPRELLTKGMAASPGAAVGRAVFDSPTAKAWADRGEQVVLVRRETNPDDLEGMIAADGILTARGGKTSHAAVVARGMGKTCVCGAEELDVDASTRTARVGTVLIEEGDEISIDGSTGEIFLGAMPVVPSPVETYIESGLDARPGGRRRRDRRAGEGRRPVADPCRRPPAPGDPRERRHRRGRGPREIPWRAGHRPVPHRAHVPRRSPGPDRAGHPGRQHRGARRRAGRVVAAAAQGLRRVARRDGRAAGDHPAAGSAAARVPAGPHRTRGQGRPRRGQRGDR